MTANEMEILSKQEMEEKHFQSVINAFASYRRHSSAILMQVFELGPPTHELT